MQKVNQQLNIRKRENGSYEARVTIAGKRYSRYGRSEAEVKRKIKQLQNEFEKEHVIAENVRLNVAMEAYLQDIKPYMHLMMFQKRFYLKMFYHIFDSNF